MSEARLTLSLLPGTFAVCRLDRDAEIPAWALSGDFASVIRTQDELSIVCAEPDVPKRVKSERGWRALKVAGPLDFSLTGVVASLTTPLAEAQVPDFVISTYQTDYLMVRKSDLERAILVLSQFGHTVLP
jgi:hypothetical protein